jgi:hypothetical protein
MASGFDLDVGLRGDPGVDAPRVLRRTVPSRQSKSFGLVVAVRLLRSSAATTARDDAADHAPLGLRQIFLGALREHPAEEVVEDHAVRLASPRDDISRSAGPTMLALTAINHPPSIESGSATCGPPGVGMVENTIPLDRTGCVIILRC